MLETVAPWIAFNLFVIAMLAVDLGVFHRKAHAVALREALMWTVVWITVALLFCAGIFYVRGSETALEFLTGYIIEKSLSVDNIFVFVMIFTALAVPATSQHRVLFWGILGALILRGTMILVGTVLLERYHWIIYVFGVFLLYTGVRMVRDGDDDLVHPEENPFFKLLSRFLPMTDRYDGDKFFVRRATKLLATPLFVVLFVVESSDVLFAVDSIPAVFAVTRDPFIVYTSNVLAILGLRALYFVFANIITKFHYLKPGVAVILAYVGTKMVLTDIIHIPAGISLLVILGVLAVAIVASIWRERQLQAQERAEEAAVQVTGASREV